MRLKGIIILLNLFLITGSIAAPPKKPINPTQVKINALNQQINTLEKALSNAHDKRGTLTKELAGTDKLIGNNVQLLHQIQHDMHLTESKITSLGQNISSLNQQLKQHQALLAEHIKHRYEIGEYQPIKWLVNQDEPTKISRLFTYYRYLVKKRQELIDKINETQKNIGKNQETLHHQLNQKQALEHALAKKQYELHHNKQYQTHLMLSLDNQIQTHQQHLSIAKHNRDNLSHLLSRLTVQSLKQPSISFPRMKQKLPPPVLAGKIRQERQGVTIIAGEGAAVRAVYPGKVVFSDWLNGYGLLMIIDHGQGFMTLYAHNQSLFKRKGQQVTQGERVASVGHTGGAKENGLYFEVRYRGVVVPARKFLA